MTSRLVAAALVGALACFGLAITRGLPAGAIAPLAAAPGGALRLEPAALETLGVALLVASTLARLAGLAAERAQAGDRRALASTLTTLALLAVSLLAARLVG